MPYKIKGHLIINKGKNGIFINGEKVDYFSLFQYYIEISQNGKPKKREYPYKVFINGFQRVDRYKLIDHHIRDSRYFGAKCLF